MGTTHGLEWGSACEGETYGRGRNFGQHHRTGRTEGSGRRVRNMDCVTEYPLSAGGVFGVGAASVVAGEHQGRNSEVYEDNKQDTHALRRDLISMGY